MFHKFNEFCGARRSGFVFFPDKDTGKDDFGFKRSPSERALVIKLRCALDSYRRACILAHQSGNIAEQIVRAENIRAVNRYAEYLLELISDAERHEKPLSDEVTL